MAVDYQVIRNEVDNNPEAIADLSWSQTDVWIRDKLNTPGINGEIIADSRNIDMNLIMAEFDQTELDELTTNKYVMLSGMIARDGINPTGGLKVIRNVFGAGTTRSNLEALVNRDASRSEVLVGQNISEQDVHIARRLP